jgi:hypothetical protein
LLLDTGAARAAETRHEIVPVTLVVRSSCGAGAAGSPANRWSPRHAAGRPGRLE